MTEDNSQLEAIKILINGIHIAHSKNCFNLFEAEVLARARAKRSWSPKRRSQPTRPHHPRRDHSQTLSMSPGCKIDITDV